MTDLAKRVAEKIASKQWIIEGPNDITDLSAIIDAELGPLRAERDALREALREYVIVTHSASKQPVRNDTGEIVGWEKTIAGVECTMCNLLPDDGLEHHEPGCLAALATGKDAT